MGASRQSYRLFLGVALGLALGATEVLATDWMYWSEASPPKIRRAHLDGTGAEDIITTGLQTPRNVKVAGDRLYWVDIGTGKVESSDWDGSNRRELATGQNQPYGVAVDTRHGKVYWSVANPGKIMRCNLDGSNPVTFLYPYGMHLWSVNAPQLLALDVAGGMIYWSDDSAEIWRTNLADGSGSTLLVDVRFRVVGLDLDLLAGMMYWAISDNTHEEIDWAGMDGSGPEPLVTSLLGPLAVAVDAAAGRLYWTDEVARKIQRAGTSGLGRQDVLVSFAGPEGLSLAPAGAGTVPDGSGMSEVPLTVTQTAAGDVVLSWGGTCLGDQDYAVYQGSLGDPGSHVPLACSTGGATTYTVSGAEASGVYYLVVPINVPYEGSYGTDSSGVERPPSLSACFPQAVRSCPLF